MSTSSSMVGRLLEELVASGLQLSVDPAARQRASTDRADVSPILMATLPATLADAVAYPRTAAEIPRILQAAARHQVPVTPRGRGTGSYGQAVPFCRGLVVDLSGCTRILQVGDGWIHAEAGTTFVALEAAARRHGQELAIMPTTVRSTLGGFLAGGAGGIGSIEHGWIWDGYVHAVEVVGCTRDAQPVTVTGAACQPMLHAYGVSGLITTATVALAPARTWTTLMTSFTDREAVLQAGQQLLELAPAPRLVSVDEPGLVATYPTDPAMPPDCYSLRAVIDHTVVQTAISVVTDHGGTVEATGRKPDYLRSLAFNHVTDRVRRARPDLCHLQVAGSALLTPDKVAHQMMPGALLHLDGYSPGGGPDRSFAGLLFVPYTTAPDLAAGMELLRNAGVQVIDPHTWLLSDDGNLAQIRAAAQKMDPVGLLNPGKFPGGS